MSVKVCSYPVDFTSRLTSFQNRYSQPQPALFFTHQEYANLAVANAFRQLALAQTRYHSYNPYSVTPVSPIPVTYQAVAMPMPMAQQPAQQPPQKVNASPLIQGVAPRKVPALLGKPPKLLNPPEPAPLSSPSTLLNPNGVEFGSKRKAEEMAVVVAQADPTLYPPTPKVTRVKSELYEKYMEKLERVVGLVASVKKYRACERQVDHSISIVTQKISILLAQREINSKLVVSDDSVIGEKRKNKEKTKGSFQDTFRIWRDLKNYIPTQRLQRQLDEANAKKIKGQEDSDSLSNANLEMIQFLNTRAEEIEGDLPITFFFKDGDVSQIKFKFTHQPSNELPGFFQGWLVKENKK